jgi:predicted TIM-barrel fold metal-dependent hydrolase
VVVSVARTLEDDYLDASAYTARRYPPELVADTQSKSGRRKVMFATTTRWSSTSRRCRIWTAWGLDEEARELFLAGNAQRVLGLAAMMPGTAPLRS